MKFTVPKPMDGPKNNPNWFVHWKKEASGSDLVVCFDSEHDVRGYGKYEDSGPCKLEASHIKKKRLPSCNVGNYDEMTVKEIVKKIEESYIDNALDSFMSNLKL